MTDVRRNIRGISGSDTSKHKSFVDINTTANGINNFEGHTENPFYKKLQGAKALTGSLSEKRERFSQR